MADRRTFLRQFVALPLVGSSVALIGTTSQAFAAKVEGAETLSMVSLTQASDLDAELIALGHEWQAAADHCDHACDALDAAGERLRDIHPPEALFRRPSDSIAFTSVAHPYRDMRRLWFPRDSVEDLRIYAFVNPWGDPLVADQARRDEIVAAYDAWRAEISADQQATGYTSAFEVYEAAVAASRQLRLRIIAKPAITLAGVMVKARVVGRAYDNLDELRELVTHSHEQGESDADAMATSAMVDLLSMQVRAAA